MEIPDSVFEKCSDCDFEYKSEEGSEGIIIFKMANGKLEMKSLCFGCIKNIVHGMIHVHEHQHEISQVIPTKK